MLMAGILMVWFLLQTNHALLQIETFFFLLVTIMAELLYFHRHCLAGRKKSEDAGRCCASVKPKCAQEVKKYIREIFLTMLNTKTQPYLKFSLEFSFSTI